MGTGPCGDCQSCRLVERLEHPDVQLVLSPAPPRRVRRRRFATSWRSRARRSSLARRADPFHLPATSGPRRTSWRRSGRSSSWRRPPGDGVAQGVRGGRRGADGAAGVEPGGGQRLPEAAGGAAGGHAADPDLVAARVAAPHHPLARAPRPPAPAGRRRWSDFLVRRKADAGGPGGCAWRRLPEAAIGRALRLLPGRRPGPRQSSGRRGGRCCWRPPRTGATPRFAAAHAQAPAGGRGEFTGSWRRFSAWLRDLMAAATGADDWWSTAAMRRRCPRRCVDGTSGRWGWGAPWTGCSGRWSSPGQRQPAAHLGRPAARACGATCWSGVRAAMTQRDGRAASPTWTRKGGRAWWTWATRPPTRRGRWRRGGSSPGGDGAGDRGRDRAQGNVLTAASSRA